MALHVGSRLGHYEVTAKIGEGGMGDVHGIVSVGASRPGRSRLGLGRVLLPQPCQVRDDSK